MRIASMAVFAAALAASSASAQESGFTLGPNVSTLGIGAEAGYRINRNFGLRGGANYFSWSTNREIDGIDYDADLRLASGGIVGDYYPFGGGFRISGGVRISGNQVDLVANPGATAQVEIGGTTYTGSQIGRLDGELSFNRVAPYLGLGYEANVTDALSISFDAGALWQGRPDVSLRAAPPAGAPPALVDRINADVERERRNIEDDLKAFQFFPVVSVTAKYRFGPGWAPRPRPGAPSGAASSVQAHVQIVDHALDHGDDRPDLSGLDAQQGLPLDGRLARQQDVAQAPPLLRQEDVHLAPVMHVSDALDQTGGHHRVHGRDGGRLLSSDPLAQLALGQPVLLPQRPQEIPLADRHPVWGDPVLERA